MNNYSNYDEYMRNQFGGCQMPNQNMITPNWNGVDMNAMNQMMMQKPSIPTTKSQPSGSQKLYDPYDAFIRGNLFPNLYQGYKTMKPFQVEPMNEQAELLTYLDSFAFAAHELNLYLDNYPNDKEKVKLFKEYSREAKRAMEEYEKAYGPLLVTGVTSADWTWVNDPWPWENN